MTFIVVLIGWIFSLSLHEFAHALVAYYGGDTSVKDKGYLTFNPLKYTHPLYSIALPLLFLFMGGIGLPGGAVYIETWRLRSGKWRSAVSLAGPSANIILVIIIAILLLLMIFIRIIIIIIIRIIRRIIGSGSLGGSAFCVFARALRRRGDAVL